jgi:2-isopropylmalate synthase
MTRKIEIYDTTLRDGAQMRDISFSVNDKLRILEILDDLGFAYVEGGWPGANPKDVDFFTEAKKLNLKNTSLTAFGSTRKANTTIENDPILAALLRAETEVICIVAKSSAWQVENTMKASLDENLKMLDESIKYLKSKDRKVFLDAEHFFDGYAENSQYSKKFIQAAIDAGADRMVLCDTNGGSLPEKVFSVTEELVKEFGNKIGFGIHAHNDGELAVANSIRAIRAGAVQVQGTVNGYGERCGNANLISVIPNLQLKYSQDKLICIPEGKLSRLTSSAKAVAEIANMNLNHSQAFVGERAFTHKGGLHASALAKDKTSYEHIDPSLVGNKTTVVVSDQSGVSNIVDWFKNNDIDLSDEAKTKEAASEVLFKIKELENEGYSFENAGASFEILVKKTLKLVPNYFDLVETNVHVVNGEKTEATVRLRIGGAEKHSVSLGNGPTNALDNALRKALEDFYPEITNFQLQDFKVRIIDSHLGTAAITKVQISTGWNRSEKLSDARHASFENPQLTSSSMRNSKNENSVAGEASRPDSWNTIGVSANIVKASWDAVVESVVYGLMTQAIPSRNNPQEEVLC